MARITQGRITLRKERIYLNEVIERAIEATRSFIVAGHIAKDRRKHVVLVALTGYGREEDKQQALAAGFDYHLVKPVNPDALHGLVSRLGKPESEKPTVH